MDIQKENNLIQEAFEVEADEIGFCLDQKWGDYENPYENSDTALAFNLFKKGWQAKAQAIPEGFVLVEREKLAMIFETATNALVYHVAPPKHDALSIIQGIARKAMIEAQEQAK